jgi:hypothetical protein
MDEKKIYLISVLGADGIRYRVWGYYFDREDAQRCILHNDTDISELGYYRYGILTEIGEGPLAIEESQEWYEFVWGPDRELLEVRKIDKPEQYESTMFGF